MLSAISRYVRDEAWVVMIVHCATSLDTHCSEALLCSCRRNSKQYNTQVSLAQSGTVHWEQPITFKCTLNRCLGVSQSHPNHLSSSITLQ